MKNVSREKATDLLQCLIDQTLWFGTKPEDDDRYYWGFGEPIKALNKCGETINFPPYHLRACKIDIVWKNGEKRVVRLRESLLPCEFEKVFFDHIYGLRVKRVTIGDDNRLWIDLSDYWIVFLIAKNLEKSWEFLKIEDKLVQVIASDCNLKITEKPRKNSPIC